MQAIHILKTGSIVVLLAAFASGLHVDRTSAPDDPLDAAIAQQTLRVEAAEAAMQARPLIGDSHLPKFDAAAALNREEAEWRRLIELRQRVAEDANRAP